MAQWLGRTDTDDFGATITDTLIDAKTKYGPWALMTPESFKVHGLGRLGLGFGQKYQLDSTSGKFNKIDG